MISVCSMLCLSMCAGEVQSGALGVSLSHRVGMFLGSMLCLSVKLVSVGRFLGGTLCSSRFEGAHFLLWYAVFIVV